MMTSSIPNHIGFIALRVFNQIMDTDAEADFFDSPTEYTLSRISPDERNSIEASGGIGIVIAKIVDLIDAQKKNVPDKRRRAKKGDEPGAKAQTKGVSLTVDEWNQLKALAAVFGHKGTVNSFAARVLREHLLAIGVVVASGGK